MAAYIPVPRDLTRVKTKVFFNLTKRQLICFGSAALIGVPIFFLVKGTGNVSLAALTMMIVMLPLFFLAMYEKDGQPLEVIAGHFIQAKFIRNPEQNTFDIDEEVAPIVVRIFEMRANGVALNSIAKTLNDEGVPCPGKLRYIRGITKAAKYENALWIHGTLRKILMDQVYIGNRVHGRVKRDKVGMEKTRRSEEEWQVIENAHAPIVSEELFEAVQSAMSEAAAKRNSYKKQEAPETDHRDTFREKVYCGDCGSMMRGCKGLGRADENGDRKAFIYYDCGKYLDSGRAVCSSHYVRQEDIMDTLRNALDTQLCAAVDLEQFIKEVQSMPKVVHYESSVQNQLSSIQSKRRHMELRLEQLIVDLTEGLIDKDEYRE